MKALLILPLAGVLVAAVDQEGAEESQDGLDSLGTNFSLTDIFADYMLNRQSPGERWADFDLQETLDQMFNFTGVATTPLGRVIPFLQAKVIVIMLDVIACTGDRLRRRRGVPNHLGRHRPLLPLRRLPGRRVCVWLGLRHQGPSRDKHFQNPWRNGSKTLPFLAAEYPLDRLRLARTVAGKLDQGLGGRDRLGRRPLRPRHTCHALAGANDGPHRSRVHSHQQL